MNDNSNVVHRTTILSDLIRLICPQSQVESRSSIAGTYLHSVCTTLLCVSCVCCLHEPVVSSCTVPDVMPYFRVQHGFTELSDPSRNVAWSAFVFPGPGGYNQLLRPLPGTLFSTCPPRTATSQDTTGEVVGSQPVCSEGIRCGPKSQPG